jgi:hypothetical protein
MSMHILSYIDPGAGALIWQSIVGIFVGIVFYMRRTRRWLGRLVGRILGNEPSPSNNVVPVPLEKGKAEVDSR